MPQSAIPAVDELVNWLSFLKVLQTGQIPKTEHLGISRAGSLRAGCPSYCPLKETTIFAPKVIFLYSDVSFGLNDCVHCIHMTNILLITNLFYRYFYALTS